ncbi:HNH endonuclease [Dokdonia sp. Asnod2-E02]|uniref:HNH endonuclease n=1 Tax=Dokdonia sp. Asnod2-E02 TaxID=3160574 RepID=UPI00386E8B58
MEPTIILVCCLIVFIIAIIYGVIENEKQRKLCKEYIKNNTNIINSPSVLKNAFDSIGKQLPPCQKCNCRNMQVWDFTSTLLIIRCVDCKKKIDLTKKINIEDLNTIAQIKDYLLIPFLSKVGITLNDKSWAGLKAFLIYDFFSLRLNAPYHRAITFKAEGQDNINTSDIVEKRSRYISQSVKDKVWNRDNGKCVECGSNLLLEFDHIIPFAKGGSNTYRNIQLLCEPCNRLKSAKIG